MTWEYYVIAVLLTAVFVSSFICYMNGFTSGMRHEHKYPSITDKLKWISKQ